MHVHVHKGEIFYYCLSSTPVVLCGRTFFCKKKCSSSGQKDNTENVSIASDIMPGYFFSVVKGIVNMACFQLMHA